MVKASRPKRRVNWMRPGGHQHGNEFGSWGGNLALNPRGKGEGIVVLARLPVQETYTSLGRLSSFPDVRPTSKEQSLPILESAPQSGSLKLRSKFGAQVAGSADRRLICGVSRGRNRTKTGSWLVDQLVRKGCVATERCNPRQ